MKYKFASGVGLKVLPLSGLLLLMACGPAIVVTPAAPTVIPGVAIEGVPTASLFVSMSTLVAFDDVRLPATPENAGGGRVFTVPAGRHTIVVRRDWGDQGYKGADGQPAPSTTNRVELVAKPRGCYRVQYWVETGRNHLTALSLPYIYDCTHEGDEGYN